MHKPTTPGLDGVVGIAKQYGHKWAEKLAEAIAHHPSVATLIGNLDPTGGVGTAQIIKVVSGYYDFPGSGPLSVLANDLFDVFASELAGLIEKYKDDPEGLAAAIADKTEKAAADVMKRRVRIIGNNYVPENCPHGFPKPFTKKGDHEPEAPTRGQAIALGMKPTNCGCYGVLIEELKPGHGTRADAPAKPKAEGFVLFIARLKTADRAHADAVWAYYATADRHVQKPKIARAFATDTEARVLALKVFPRDQWDLVIDEMLGGGDKTVDGIVAKISKLIEKAGGRFESEELELGRVVASVGDIADNCRKTVAGWHASMRTRRLAIRSKRLALEAGIERERSWFRWGMFLIVATVGLFYAFAWAGHAIRQNNTTPTTEVTNG